MGKWRLVHNFDKVIKHLDAQAPAIAEATARDIKWEAKKLVPHPPSSSRGYALGGLRAAIHVVTPKKSEYSQAMVAATSISGSRIAKRGQALPPVQLHRLPHLHTAVVDVPVSYANLIHDGFYHVRANKFIVGTAYLYSAANEHRDTFIHRVASIFAGMPNVPDKRVKRTFASDEEREDYYNSLALSRVNAEVQRDIDLANDNANARLGHFSPRAGLEIGEAWEERRNQIDDLRDFDDYLG